MSKQDPIEIRKMREREIRDIYNFLYKTYRSPRIIDFIRENYFFAHQSSVWGMIKRSDNLPVDMSKASIIYKTVFSDGFHL